jgi:putative nucleotidyltransferase with HDIG domain
MDRRRVSELQAGMVLAEDVLTPGGRFLMPQGTVLDAGHLKSLLAWDLPTVAVRKPAVPPADPPASPALAPAGTGDVDRPERSAAAAAVVRQRLSRCDAGHVAIRLLHRLAVVREVERLAFQGGIESDPGTDGGRTVSSEPTLPPLAPESILRDEPQLVSPPEVYLRISEVLRNPKSTLDDAAEAIRHDPSLAAKLLRLVNSPFYARTMRAVHGRFPAKVDSLSRAVMVVGGRQLSTLALGVSVLPLFQDIPQKWVNMRLFWEHSLACAALAQAIAAATRQANPETAFVAGLMHDIGRVILFKQASRHMAVAMRQAMAERTPLVAVEQAVLGFSHADLGGMLLAKWQFPAHLEHMVRDHHTPASGVGEVAVIHVADVVANAMAWGGSGSQVCPPLDPAAWELLGLGVDTLEELVSALESSLGETMHCFFPDHGGPP